MALAVDKDKEHVGTPPQSPTDDPAVHSDHSSTGLYTFVYNTRSAELGTSLL